jgi:flavin reductase (DIM6/NTAB) family NADH-FMN oxidoreductase RutF
VDAGAQLTPQVFREIMACFPTGVAVVTALDDHPRGLTVNSFCSVSLEPPLVLVCVDRASNTFPAIRAAGGFTVNFLALGRERLAVRFASKADDKFAGVAWTAPAVAEGGPILVDDSSAYAACVTRTAFEAGDHWVFVGQVHEGGVIEDRAPLVYHRRTYVALRDV